MCVCVCVCVCVCMCVCVCGGMSLLFQVQQSLLLSEEVLLVVAVTLQLQLYSD